MPHTMLPRLAVLLALLAPLLMAFPVGRLVVFANLSALLFLLGAAGLLQSFLANQSLPFLSIGKLKTVEEKTDFHHIGALASLIAGCIPGVVLAYSLYSQWNEPSSLGPILAVILVTLIYALISYLMHFSLMTLQVDSKPSAEFEAAWLREHHYQLRRVFLFAFGIVLCTALVIVAAIVAPEQESGSQNFRYGQLTERTLSASKAWLLSLGHYTRLPLWIVLTGIFCKLIIWGRSRLGYSASNNAWILSNLALVFGVISTMLILIDMLLNLVEPFSFMFPTAPLLILALSWGLSMGLSRKAKSQKFKVYQIQTEFSSSRLWTRVFQVACLAIVVLALSLGGFAALTESFLSIGFVCLFGIYSLSRQRKLETMVDRRTEELKQANQRNEALLHNVLPVSIAERLKSEQESTIADDHADVSILFADIAGFTAMSSEMSSSELVKLLSSVFARFDELAEKHRVEKIKTIGDAYMVAAGVPKERPDHAHALAAFALDMQRELKQISREYERALDIRIGIHSGPVTAGVIGTRKFAYDLWGDTVNTASRMESNGEVGSIQISERTKSLVEDAYIVQPRGKIAMKGKGELMTYFLCAAHEGAS